MNEYSKLKDLLLGVGGGKDITIYQGIVNSVDGCMCEVQIGGIAIPDVRLRASEMDDEGEMLVTPKIGTAVTVGSLSGDLTQLVVLQVDHIESIVINGGKLGGLINIEQLTDKINGLVDTFNSHTHTGVHGATSAPNSPASSFRKGDYEDETIRH
ncbi:MAG: hypothetical protein IJ606_02440 [Bacteroidaceae bacterium]|nr:hypothetical protein [Bacteroidaceae bacterium]